ncbi:MAG: anthranilate phosphoribosyltransferase [Parvularcula sp.]
MSETFSQLLKLAAAGQVLESAQMQRAFSQLLSGTVDPIQSGAFLVALKVRGETPEEIVAAARAMREAALSFEGPADAIDTCGTGGDGANTFNISTATAIVLAACGVPVAKHGNRAVSSASGSSDVLAALGVKLDIPREHAAACLKKIGIAFLFAPHFHPAIRHVAPVRKALGVRTLFNLLGPLTNPAGAKRQLLGVYDRALTAPIAEALKSLGATRAWVVHGADGLDELTVTGPSFISELKDGVVADRTVQPEEARLMTHNAGELVGGDAATNAEAIHELFAGGLPAYRDAVLLNAAAGLIVSGWDDDLPAAAAHARQAIETGAAREKLDQLVAFTQSAP